MDDDKTKKGRVSLSQVGLDELMHNFSSKKAIDDFVENATGNFFVPSPYTLTLDEAKDLLRYAAKGMMKAFCPRSNFPVGAAVLTTKGNIYQGNNVESIISGLGICAERSAIDHAIAHGEYLYNALAVISKDPKPIKPCGMCRQYIAEFSQVIGKDIPIIMIGIKGHIEISSVNQLLPSSFGPQDLGLDLTRYRHEKLKYR